MLLCFHEIFHKLHFEYLLGRHNTWNKRKVHGFYEGHKTEEIFTVDLKVCSKCQIDGKDFVDFCGLLRRYDF